VDRDRIAAALAHAREHLADDAHAATARRRDGAGDRLRAPDAPDADGFVAIGELHDPMRERTGDVLRRPATGSVRLIWTSDAPPFSQS
jgi:hypothetical protein